MKKTLGFLMVCLLGACAQKDQKKYTIPTADLPFFTQPMDTAPFPWLHILPSERAAFFKEVDFGYLHRLIRHVMVPFPDKFSRISLILVDYTIIPPEKPFVQQKKGIGLQFCEKYIPKPERYFLEIRFYENNTRPPCPPLYVGTVVTSPRTAPLDEAIKFMVDSLMWELASTSSHRIHLNLDAQTAAGNTLNHPKPPSNKKAPPPGDSV